MYILRSDSSCWMAEKYQNIVNQLSSNLKKGIHTEKLKSWFDSSLTVEDILVQLEDSQECSHSPRAWILGLGTGGRSVWSL